MVGGVSRCFFWSSKYVPNFVVGGGVHDVFLKFWYFVPMTTVWWRSKRVFLVGSINYDGCRFIFHQFNLQILVNFGSFWTASALYCIRRRSQRRPKILFHYRPVGRVSQVFFEVLAFYAFRSSMVEFQKRISKGSTICVGSAFCSSPI